MLKWLFSGKQWIVVIVNICLHFYFSFVLPLYSDFKQGLLYYSFLMLDISSFLLFQGDRMTELEITERKNRQGQRQTEKERKSDKDKERQTQRDREKLS